MSLICKVFGHNKKGKRYSPFDFEDGKVSWSTVCPRCNKILYCIQGYVKGQPDYICSTELNNQSEKLRQEILNS